MHVHIHSTDGETKFRLEPQIELAKKLQTIATAVARSRKNDRGTL